MKLSELIWKAQNAMEKHGDIPVVSPDPGCGCCGSGNNFATDSIVSDVWVYDYSSEHGSVPLAFKVEG